MSLCENFVGKTLIEYPQLVIVLGSHLAEYCLLDDLLGGEEKRERLKRGTELKEGATHATVHRQKTMVVAEKSKPEEVEKCSREDASALELIAQSYSDSDDD